MFTTNLKKLLNCFVKRIIRQYKGYLFLFGRVVIHNHHDVLLSSHTLTSSGTHKIMWSSSNETEVCMNFVALCWDLSSLNCLLCRMHIGKHEELERRRAHIHHTGNYINKYEELQPYGALYIFSPEASWMVSPFTELIRCGNNSTYYDVIIPYSFSVFTQIFWTIVIEGMLHYSILS